MPESPSDKSYQQLKVLLKDHLSPKPIVIAERFKYHQRQQKEGETVGDFLAELKKLSEPCKFGGFLEEALRDRFVCGLKSTGIQKKLLAERELILQRASEIATGMEAAEKQAAPMKPSTEVVSKVQKLNIQDKKQSSTQCFRCGKTGHAPERCFHRNSKCYSCQQVGHLNCKCPRKKQDDKW